MNFEEIELQPVKLRQSCASCAQACERKWFLQYRMGVKLRGGEFRDAAELGSIYHRFMLEGVGGDQAVRGWVAKKQLDLVGLIQQGADLDGRLSAAYRRYDELFDIAQAMAHIFWERFPQPDWFVTVGREIKHECMFRDVLLSGTIDKLILHERTKELWIRDYKSTGRALEAIFSGAAWGLQPRVYRILMEDWVETKPELKDYKIRGFILDGITKPGIKLCRTDEKNSKEWNCTIQEAYLRRVREWYQNEEGKKDTKMMRSRAILYTEDRVGYEMGEVLEQFREFANLKDPNPDLYKRDVTRRECFAWEKQCIYHDLCSTDPKNWDDLFETKYEIKPTVEEETEDGKSED